MSCEQTTSTNPTESKFSDKTPSITPRTAPYASRTTYRKKASLYAPRVPFQLKSSPVIGNKPTPFGSKAPLMGPKAQNMEKKDDEFGHMCLDFIFEATQTNAFVLTQSGDEIIYNL